MKDFFQGPFLDSIKRIFGDISGKLSYVNNPAKNVLIRVFALAVGLITAVSLVFVVLEFKNGETDVTVIDESMEEESTVTTTTLPVVERELNCNILFSLDNRTDKIQLLMLLQLNSNNNTANILFIDPGSICQANNVTESMNGHFKSGGMTQLIMAVERYTELHIDRYLAGDEKAFTSFIKEIGDVEVNVKNSISYSHDGLSYIIDSGNQIMTADILLKYVIYLSDNRQENIQSLCEIISIFAQKLFDCEQSQEALDNFGAVIGYFDTNISAMDFSENKAAVMKLAKRFYSKLTVVASASELS